MRFGWMLAAVAALWGGQAQAVITEGGKDLPYFKVVWIDSFEGIFPATTETPKTFARFSVYYDAEGLGSGGGSCKIAGIGYCDSMDVRWFPSGPKTVTINGYVRPLSDFAQTDARVIALSSVPEPSTWATMILGIGGIGIAMRRRHMPLATV